LLSDRAVETDNKNTRVLEIKRIGA